MKKLVSLLLALLMLLSCFAAFAEEEAATDVRNLIGDGANTI